MSMNVGGRRGMSAEINMTPMIDVLLTLIIIFMIVLPHSHGEEVNVPQPSPNTPQPPAIVNKTVVLEIKFVPQGPPLLTINKEPVQWSDLHQKLASIYDIRPEKIMFVKADSTLEWEEVARAIDTAHFAGVKTIGLLTEKMGTPE